MIFGQVARHEYIWYSYSFSSLDIDIFDIHIHYYFLLQKYSYSYLVKNLIFVLHCLPLMGRVKITIGVLDALCSARYMSNLSNLQSPHKVFLKELWCASWSAPWIAFWSALKELLEILLKFLFAVLHKVLKKDIP